MQNYYSNARELLSKMTLREKIGQITQIVAGYRCYDIGNNGDIEFRSEFYDVLKQYGSIGAISGLLRADPWSQRDYGTGITLGMRTAAAKKLQREIANNTRLKIPAFIEVEASHGLQSLGSVMYPTGLCCAASFNTELYHEMMENIGNEIRLSDNHIAFVTLIDVARDSRWGRIEECLGEDPYLASQFASAGVKGIKQGGVLACAKHFLGAGACEGGINCAPINAGQREIEEIHLPPAKAAVDAGCDFVMVAYNMLDGTYMHTNGKYIKDCLRDKLGFDGVVISDGFGVSTVASKLGISKGNAAVLCIKSGIDLSLADGGAFTELEQAVNDGIISEEDIDNACLKVLSKKFEAGLFDEKDKSQTVEEFNADKHFEKTAYKMAGESITLLKNESVLPLKTDKKIALIGENAADIYHILGDYTSQRLQNEGANVVTAFKETFDSVIYQKGWSFDNNNDFDSALEAVKEADVVVLTLGGTSRRDFDAKYLSNGALVESSRYIDCGEGCSLAALELPRQQIEMLKRLKKTGKKIVSVVFAGRAYVLDEVGAFSDALLVAWYPGQEGGRALADILVGKINPSGKLPVTLPCSAAVLPLCYNSYYGESEYVDIKQTVLYPFGFGLSYSKFEYSNLSVETKDDSYNVSFDIENTSQVDGKETAQLYVKLSGDAVAHRNRELKAFKKVLIKAGEILTVTFTLKKADLKFCDPIEPKVDIFIGDSGNAVLSASVLGIR